MIDDVLRGSQTLSGVLKADAVDVVLAGGDGVGGAGRSQHEDALFMRDVGDDSAGAGGDGGEHEGHAIVEKLVVSVHAQLTVALVVFSQNFELDAALGVDFLGGDLRAVLNGEAVYGVSAGHRADDANLDRFSAGKAGAHDHRQSQDESKNLLHKSIPLSFTERDVP